MTEQNFIEALQIYNQICEMINYENEINQPDCNFQFEVLQFSNLFRHPHFEDYIAMLYDSYSDNRDFIHLPCAEMIRANSRQFPIIIARRKDNGALLGACTVKYFENDESYLNPYYPKENAHYFEISGLLVHKDNAKYGFPNIGKLIVEIAILGASKYHETHPETKMIGVIDVRNKKSMNAARVGLQMIKEHQRFGAGFELTGHVVGYYEVHDFETDELTEAQTLVIELSLAPTRIKEADPILINLEQQGENLTETVEQIFQNVFGPFTIIKGETIIDSECGNVIYYTIRDSESTRIENLSIVPALSAFGNNRTEAGLGTLLTSTTSDNHRKVAVYGINTSVF